MVKSWMTEQNVLSIRYHTGLFSSVRWVGAAPNCGKFKFENSQKKGRVYCVVLYKL